MIKYVYHTSSDTKQIGERHFGPTVEKYNRFIGQWSRGSLRKYVLTSYTLFTFHT